jgi:hypothetical protein
MNRRAGVPCTTSPLKFGAPSLRLSETVIEKSNTTSPRVRCWTNIVS